MKTYMAILLLALPVTANAQVCNVSPDILKCFHPTASFVGCDQRPDDSATIYFRGGITGRPYQMTVVGEKMNGFGRIVLLSDNATLPPNPGCQIGEWRPLVWKY